MNTEDKDLIIIFCIWIIPFILLMSWYETRNFMICFIETIPRLSFGMEYQNCNIEDADKLFDYP